MGSTTGTSVKVKFTTATSASAILSVKANNSCSSSPWRTLSINVNLGCRTIEEQITETSSSIGFSIYPVPANDRLNIEFNADGTFQYDLLIRDISGKIVMDRKVDVTEGKNNIELSTESFVNGAYLITISNDQDVVLSKRIAILKGQ